MQASANTENVMIYRISQLLRTEQGADEAGLSGSDRAIRCGECGLLQRRKLGHRVPPPRQDAAPNPPTALRGVIT
jgi:hypothetical protein